MTHPTTLHPFDDDKERDAQEQLDAETARLRGLASNRSAGMDRHDAEARLVNRCALIAEACGPLPNGSPRFTTADVLGWVRRSVEMGASIPNMGPETVEDLCRITRVANAPIRERFLALLPDFLLTHEITDEHKKAAEKLGADPGTYAWAAEIGARIGETRDRNGQEVGDATRVLRFLGLALTRTGRELPACRLFVSYEQGVAFADALDMEYSAAGV